MQRGLVALLVFDVFGVWGFNVGEEVRLLLLPTLAVPNLHKQRAVQGPVRGHAEPYTRRTRSNRYTPA